jgi:hypothetical protein
MDQGFDFKALRNPTASNTAPFSMLQRPTNLRKPFAFIQTQSRNNTENHSVPSGSHGFSDAESSRRHVEPLRMKQEPNDHNSNTAFSNARNHQQQPSLIPQPRNETKTQSNKLRAFTMMAPTPSYDRQHADTSRLPCMFLA